MADKFLKNLLNILLCSLCCCFLLMPSSTQSNPVVVVSTTNNTLNLLNQLNKTSVRARFIDEVQAHHEFGLDSPSFMTRLITHMFELFNVKQVIQDIKLSKTTEATCHSCKFGMGMLQHLLQFGRGKDELAKLSNSICVNLRIESPRVCKGISDVYKVSFTGCLSSCFS